MVIFMSKIYFNNTFSSGCVQFMAADWSATTAHKMIYLLTSYTVPALLREKKEYWPSPCLGQKGKQPFNCF